MPRSCAPYGYRSGRVHLRLRVQHVHPPAPTLRLPERAGELKIRFAFTTLSSMIVSRTTTLFEMLSYRATTLHKLHSDEGVWLALDYHSCKLGAFSTQIPLAESRFGAHPSAERRWLLGASLSALLACHVAGEHWHLGQRGHGVPLCLVGRQDHS